MLWQLFLDALRHHGREAGRTIVEHCAARRTANDLTAKRLEILREIVPKLRRMSPFTTPALPVLSLAWPLNPTTPLGLPFSRASGTGLY